MDKKFIISVIMPLYNIEDYLRESINSIIQQSIGFEKNIQIIMVNDGSTDDTKSICLEYRKKYPENIIYKSKENGGVSAARNFGFNFATGKYVNFFDGDDKWEKDAFKNALDFFEAHYEEVDFVSCRDCFFDEKEGYTHVLDYKYTSDYVVDVKDKYDHIQLFTHSVIFKKTALSGIKFNEKVHYAEDIPFVSEVLLNKLKYGIIKSSTYFYRQRIQLNSLSNKYRHAKEWYNETIKLVYERVMELSIERYHSVLPYYQYVVMYEIQWRAQYNESVECLDLHEKEEYLQSIKNILLRIDDNIIFEQKNLTRKKRVNIFALKYGEEFGHMCYFEKRFICFNGMRLISLSAAVDLEIKSIKINNGKIKLIADLTNKYWNGKYELFVKGEYNYYQCYIFDYDSLGPRNIVGIKEGTRQYTEIEMPVFERKLRFYLRRMDDKTQEVLIRPKFDILIGLEKKSRYRFVEIDNYFVRHVNGSLLVIKKSWDLKIKRTGMFLIECVRRKAIPEIKAWLLYKKTAKVKKQIGIISTRGKGKPVGNVKNLIPYLEYPVQLFTNEAPYTYNQQKELHALLTTSKVIIVDDYNRFLRTLDKKSNQRVIQLWHASGAFKNFGKDGTNQIPQIDAEYHRNYDLVTTSSADVIEIYANAFQIDSNNVKDIGVARTDEMFNEQHKVNTLFKFKEKYPEIGEKQVILYAPTFRDRTSGSRLCFRPGLNFDILSKKLLENQVFVVCPHPVMSNNILDREYDNIIEIRDFPTQEVMIRADMLITDYSSVIFEFSLLKKPIAFYCYDYDSYDRNFYINYPDDLPGPMFKTENELIDFIVNNERHVISENYDAFIKKYMHACDGKSSKRIAQIINSFIKSDKWDI